MLNNLSIALAAMVLIFDTDSGFFADDGAALTMLMRSKLAPALKGVTVVSGNVWAAEGVEYMERNLRLLQHPRVPVLLGAQEPLVHTAAMVKKEGPLDFAGALGEKPVSAKPLIAKTRSRNAVEFILQTIDANPGKVTFIAIGPMTNLAIALRLRPDIATKIERLVFMGGAVDVPGNTTKKAEFNFWFDPEAAQAVFRSAIPHKIMFGLDATNHAPIRKADYEQIVAVKTPITELYAEDMGNRYPAFNKNPDAVTYMWDALVSAYLLDPSIVTEEQSRYLDVDTRFGPDYGAVTPLDRALAPGATPVEVVLNIDKRRAWSMYKAALIQRDVR
jgi:inosine-uridine nucleoside N-ribohydrolase